jgi:Tfp pilus assembly protein PilV
MIQNLKKKVRKNDRGSSLVETMIAMSFLSMGLLGVAQMIPTGLAAVTQARVETLAVQAAQEKLDEVRSNDFTAPILSAGEYEETSGNYTLQWTIADADPVPGSKRIEVVALWTTSTGERSTRLTTYITAR